MQRYLSWLLAALPLPPLLAQRTTWVVDPANGPGTRFTSLQAAADDPTVAPADILLLRPGGYGRLQTGKPLVILGGPAVAIEHVAVSDLPAGSEFVLSDFFAGTPLDRLASIELRNCLGRVVVAKVSYSLPGSGMPWHRVLAAADCRELELLDMSAYGGGVFVTRSWATLRRCSLRDAHTNPPIFATGMHGLEAQQSSVDVVDCQLTGVWAGYGGSAGARIIDGSARFFASSNGGTELAGGLNPTGSNGPSISILRGHVEASPLVLLRGAVANDGGGFSLRALPALQLSMAPGSATASLHAEPGTPAMVAFGLAQPPLDLGPIGRLRLDLTFGLCRLTAGAVSPTGMLVTVQPVPQNTALIGASFVAQGAILAPGGAILLTNGACVLIE